MVTLAQLWLPIVLSAVAVFVASSIVHMALKYHNSEYRGLANEEEVASAIRRGSPAPGMYLLPYVTDPKAMADPAVAKRYADGPVGLLILRPAGAIAMGPLLMQWFVYTLVISLIVAYVASRTVAPGADYLQVFRVAGTVAFLAYAGGAAQGGIWRSVPWTEVGKDTFDGLLYGLVTAGMFGWLWPS